MRVKPTWIIAAALLSGCAAQPVPQADWANLRMGMSYSQVVEIVGPPQRKLQAGERLDGAITPAPDIDVYVWRVKHVTKSAAFTDDHLNGLTGQFE